MKRKLLLFFVAMCVFLCIGCRGNDVQHEESGKWEKVPINLPDNSGRIIFLRKQIHPLLAEYDRKIKIETKVHKDAVRPLPMNVGGRTKINIYWYPKEHEQGPFLRMQDHWGEYLVDLGRGVTRLVVRCKGFVYAGDISSNHSGHSISWSDDAPEDVSVSVEGKPAEKIKGRLAESTGQYLGRLDSTDCPLRFIPALEDPEEKIPLVKSEI